MASSSSDEEELARFVEAADTSLYYNALYRTQQGQSEIVAPAPSLASLRNVDDKEEDQLNNELRVTPAFQKHVAKHLTRILDSQLQLDGGCDEKQNCDVNSSKLKENVAGRKIARAARVLVPSRLSEGSPGTAATTSNVGGVRLLGASAVFLSSCSITPPLPQRRRKRGRKTARISSDSSSESSDEDTDSDVAHERLSRAAVTAEWVLSGEATKGWERNTRGKVINVNKNGEVCPLTSDQAASGYGTLQNVNHNNNINNNNNNDKEVPRPARDEMSFSVKSMKWPKFLGAACLDGDKLAATFDSAVSLTNDSSEKPKRKKRKRKRKEQQSEDATTETTEVEELPEGRKKRKKKKKKQKQERAKKEEDEVEQLLKFIDDDDVKLSPKKKKNKRKKKKKESDGLLKMRPSSKRISKKKMSKKMDHLSTDLARLMMVSGDRVVS